MSRFIFKTFYNYSRIAAFAIMGVAVGLSANNGIAQDTAGEKITFDDHVKPIFRQRCAACHGPDKKSGGLDVTNFTALMMGGSSGDSIDPGSPDDSYLFSLITHEEEPSMPPGGSKIPDAEIELIEKWIELGALENQTSKAKIKKKKFDLAMSGDAATRPEVVALPPHLPLEPVFQTPRGGCVTAVDVSPWAPIAAVASPKQILLYNTQSLELVGILPFPEGIANVLKFSRDGNLLMAGGGQDGVSGKVVVWNVATGKREIEVGDELDIVIDADISSDLKWIALGGPTRVVRVYSTRTGALAYEITKHTDWATSVSFSPDGVLLATGDRAGNLFVWEAVTGNEYLELKGHTARINQTAWRIDSNVLASASEDTTVRLWEMVNGGQIKSWGAHGGGATAVVFSRDGNLLTNGRDRVAKLWNQNGEAQKQLPALPDIGTAAAYCHETSRLIAGDWSGKLVVAELADASLVGDLVLNPPSLEQRLAVAQTELQTATTKHQPVAEELAQLSQQMNDLQSKIGATTADKQTLSTEMANVEKVLADTKKTLEVKLAEQAQLQTELEAKGKLLPELNELLAKAQSVAALSPDDAELAATAQAVAAKQQQTQQRVEQLTGMVDEFKTQTTLTEQEMQAAAEKLAAQQASLAAMDKQIAEMEAQLGPVKTAVAEKTSLVEQLQQQLAAAQGLVQRWQSEIQFVATVKTLEERIQQTQALVDEKATVREAIEAELAGVKKRLEAALADEDSAQAELEAILQELNKLQGIVQ